MGSPVSSENVSREVWAADPANLARPNVRRRRPSRNCARFSLAWLLAARCRQRPHRPRTGV